MHGVFQRIITLENKHNRINLDGPNNKYNLKSNGTTLGGEGKYIVYEFGEVSARPIDDAL